MTVLLLSIQWQPVPVLFWICLFVVVYTYIGYGVVLLCMVKIKRLFLGRKEIPLYADCDETLPEVTLMICAYNEEDIIDAKMHNTTELDYPKDKLHIMWVTDGSTDETNDRLRRYREVSVVFSKERKGKAAAINHGMQMVRTELVIMTDSNTILNSGCIKEIVRLFKDPKVGCVSGEKKVLVRTDEGQTAAKGEGVYWKYESTLKRWDSELYSAMGAAGELCAIRSLLYNQLPEDTLLDDFVISMEIVRKGYKIAYTADAYAMEYGSADLSEESKRKRRIAAGGLQSCWRLIGLLNPFRFPIVSFQFLSHRVLRWTITPICLLALIPLNVSLVISHYDAFYFSLWIFQIVFYLSATVGYLIAERGKQSRLFFIPYYFLFMNLNVFLGIKYLAQKKGSGAWEKAKRS